MDENKELEIEKNEDAPANEPETEEAEISEAEQSVSEEADESGEEQSDSENNKKLVNDILDIVESTFTTIFAIMMIFTYLLHPVNVKGESMMPTLKDYDRILMTTVYFNLEYGDIVIVDNDMAYDLDANGEPVEVNIDGKQLKECIIKRIIAVGGQTIDIRDGKVYVDGKEIDEPYIMSGAKTNSLSAFSDSYPITIPEGYYFVMGDNREHSSDSRHPDVGLIKKSQVYGKALVRYAPFSEFKFLFDTEDESAN
ncbi:MAG: signal peptidase I [Ruminococcus sp.]|nr:signal peptidase I [Ruminococcus sp.]